MHARSRSQAFTLIELLVVISIIALLIGILLPALGSARGLASDLRCKTRIRSLGQSNTLYTMDFNGGFGSYTDVLPGLWNEPAAGSRRNTFTLIDHPELGTKLTPYLGVDRATALICPVFEDWVKEEVPDEIPENGISYTYTYNSVICYDSTNYKPYDDRPIKVDQVRNTTEVAMFVEENPWSRSRVGTTPMNDGRYVVNGWPGQDALATFHQPGSQASNYASAFPGYNPEADTGGKYNTGVSHVVFVDGHVAAHPTTDSEYVAYEDDRWANRPDLWPN